MSLCAVRKERLGRGTVQVYDAMIAIMLANLGDWRTALYKEQIT